MIFLLHVECLPINFYSLTMFDALYNSCYLFSSEITFFITFTNVVLFLSRFYGFNVFFKFLLNV